MSPDIGDGGSSSGPPTNPSLLGDPVEMSPRRFAEFSSGIGTPGVLNRSPGGSSLIWWIVLLPAPTGGPAAVSFKYERSRGSTVGTRVMFGGGSHCVTSVSVLMYTHRSSLSNHTFDQGWGLGGDAVSGGTEVDVDGVVGVGVGVGVYRPLAISITLFWSPWNPFLSC